MEKIVWAFNGDNRHFPGGIFEDFAKAEEWINVNNLSGVLTHYPLDKGVFEWAIEKKLFTPKNEKQMWPEFIGGFTTASQEHYHYENGKR